MSETRELEQIYKKAHALASEDLYDEENAFLREALRKYPDDPELLVRMGASDMTTDPERAKDCLRRAYSLSPDDPWRVARCAILMADLSEFGDAERFARRAQELAPTDFVFEPDISYVLGRAAYSRHQYAEARSLLTAAFEGEPAVPEHAEWLAHFYYTAEDDAVTALKVLAQGLLHRPADRRLTTLRDQILAYVRSSTES